MHIGASAALESPNIASRSAEEWISEETSRAEAAPAPDETEEMLSEAESLKAQPTVIAAEPSARPITVEAGTTAEEQGRTAKTSTELLEAIQGKEVDAPLCMTCGTKMRPAGSCYVCEGCGSTSGCS